MCSSARRALAIATRLRRRRSDRRRRDQEGRRDPANPVNLGTLGAKSGRSPITASGSTRPARLTTPLLRTVPTGPVTAGGLKRRHRGRAVAPAAVGAGRPHPARARHGHLLAAGRRVPAAVLPPATCAYAGNVRRFGRPHIRVVPYLIRGSFRGLKMSLQEQTRRASRREPIMNRTSRLAATVLVSGVLGLAGLGPGCRYRPGRASRPISMVPRPTRAGDRRELGHECLPRRVPGRLRVPGKCWFIRL